MPRLILLWDRPQHLSDEVAARWIRAEARRLMPLAGVAYAELTQLGRASDGHRCPADWMLELHLEREADVQACIASEPCRAWMADLSLLGMRPAAILAASSMRLERAA